MADRTCPGCVTRMRNTSAICCNIAVFHTGITPYSNILAILQQETNYLGGSHYILVRSKILQQNLYCVRDYESYSSMLKPLNKICII